MSNHLTERQISELLIGCAGPEYLSHLENCPACAEKVAALQGPLRQFHDSVHEWSAQHISEDFDVPLRQRWNPPLARVCAFALLLLLTFVAVRYLTLAPTPAVATKAPAVSAAASDEALLDAVRVPREVVVDHEVCPLEVDALAGGVGGHEDVDVFVLGEGLLSLTALLPAHAAVD